MVHFPLSHVVQSIVCSSFLQQTLVKTASTKGPLHQLLSGRSSSEGQLNKSNSLGRNVASFDAKFAAVPPVQADGGGIVSGRGQASSSSMSGVSSLSGGSSGHSSTADDLDHTLTGNWEHHWETRLQRGEWIFLHLLPRPLRHSTKKNFPCTLLWCISSDHH